jgi:hypothetical protein
MSLVMSSNKGRKKKVISPSVSTDDISLRTAENESKVSTNPTLATTPSAAALSPVVADDSILGFTISRSVKALVCYINHNIRYAHLVARGISIASPVSLMGLFFA